ncbi:helicase-associated domain-containing protein [Ferviditalea candida]|uniref:Helicase-associated domain-containing protein n=1 Tax=Ferviditalea candida TaxID=3108399 RepID=A0ABU5ZFI0_9BACL|nr:helicase-associated domain-containing protein [Paenibacillaceae bacterium T2]
MNYTDILLKMPKQAQYSLPADYAEASAKIGKAYASLYHLERKTLDIIIQRLGILPFEWSQLRKASADDLTEAECKVGLARLRSRGIVFAYKKTWGERFFFIPYDLYPFWHMQALPDLYTDGWEEASDGVEVACSKPHQLADSLFLLLAYIARHQPPLNRNGSIHKRHMQQMEERLNLHAEVLDRLEVGHSGSETCSSSFAVVFDILLRYGLIANEGDRLGIRLPELAAWLSRSRSETEEELLQLWYQTRMPKNLLVQHATIAMQKAPVDRWISLKRFAERLLLPDMRSLGQFDPISAAAAIKGQWLEPLAEAGFIDIGCRCGEDWHFRWRVGPQSVFSAAVQDEGETEGETKAFFRQEDGQFYVQPDFELVIPPPVSYRIRWELESMADLVQTGSFWQYTLSKESVMRALEDGRDGKQLLDFLERHAKYGIPDNVREVLQHWSSRHSEVRLLTITLLRCKDSSAAEAIAADSGMVAHILERIGELDFIVRSERLDHLQKALEQSGYMSRRDKTGKAAKEPKAAFPSFIRHEPGCGDDSELLCPQPFWKAHGFVPAAYPVIPYDLDISVPKLDEVYPQLRDIPAMWLKDLRRYHASTARELLEKAIAWGAYVKIVTGEQQLTLLPKRLEDRMQTWSVIGLFNREEIRLTASECGEMQLILPGINDQ